MLIILIATGMLLITACVGFMLYIIFFRNGYTFTRVVQFVSGRYAVQISLIPINIDLFWRYVGIANDIYTNMPNGLIDRSNHTLQTAPRYEYNEIEEFIHKRNELIKPAKTVVSPPKINNTDYKVKNKIIY